MTDHKPFTRLVTHRATYRRRRATDTHCGEVRQAPINEQSINPSLPLIRHTAPHTWSSQPSSQPFLARVLDDPALTVPSAETHGGALAIRKLSSPVLHDLHSQGDDYRPRRAQGHHEPMSVTACLTSHPGCLGCSPSHTKKSKKDGHRLSEEAGPGMQRAAISCHAKSSGCRRRPQ